MSTTTTEAGTVIGAVMWCHYHMSDITRIDTAEGCHTTSAYGASTRRPTGTDNDTLIDDAVAVATRERVAGYASAQYIGRVTS